MKTRRIIATTFTAGVLCLWHAASAFGQNLLVNGDFEVGNTGFTSDYKFARLDSELLTYDIVSNPSRSHFLGASFGDHTSGAGLMFAANGGNDTNRVLWRQVVSVETNTAYQFSGWATPCVGPSDPDPPRIGVRINSRPISPGIQLSNPPGTWRQFTMNWNSGTSIVATIELRLETIEQGGNDPALDDLRFELTTRERVLRIVAAPAGLVGWWPGDGNAKDVAGTNHGILVNATTRPGYVGEAFAFSGQNSYVQIPNNPALNSITNALTLEAWVWHDATGGTIQRYITLTADEAQIGYSSGRLKFELHFQDGALVPIVSDTVVEPRQWYHVAGTYDGKEQRLYINGVRTGVAVVNRPTGWQPGRQAYISIAGQTMNGLIDETAIYNRALTAEEIQAHFVAGRVGMAKSPVLSGIGVFFPGNVRLLIKGIAGKAVTIESTTNLVDWVPLTTDANLTGRIEFTDTSAGAFSHRFYRAVEK